MSPSPLPHEAQEVALLRALGRRMAVLLGLIAPRYLGMPLSLAESRVLFEIGAPQQAAATPSPPTARDVSQRLGMDKGQLSRLLTKLEQAGLVIREPHAVDRRRKQLALSAAGQEVVRELTHRSAAQAEAVLALTPSAHRQELTALLQRLLTLLPQEPPLPQSSQTSQTQQRPQRPPHP